MKILWTTMVMFPPLCNKLGITTPPFCGWLYSSAKSLLALNNNIELGVIFPGNFYRTYFIEGIRYYQIPIKGQHIVDKNTVNYCKKAINDFFPDIIHIHGTEYNLAEAMVKANNKKISTIVNIQGLAGPYARYASGGLSFKDSIINISFLDFYRSSFIFNARHHFMQRHKCEDYVIKNVSDIVGRTQWDHDHVLTINPSIRYHFMNETLRDSFYKEPLWTYDKCKKHTIFVSNSGSPLKGAHQVLKALPIILREFPDTVVNFCGSSVMSNDLKTMLHFTGYHLYLRRLVKKLKLENNVRFLGSLTEEQMKEEFIKANVYVMPSAIENSPNSLCEAQILGVPVVASYCGGVPTLVEDGKTGYLYRYEEFEMLAQKIIILFGENNFDIISKNERLIALNRHDKTKNSYRLLEIYNKISNIS